MSLSELMSKLGPSTFAEIALVIFVIVFVAVGARALLQRRATVEHNRQLPFDDGTTSRHASNESSSADSAPRSNP